MDGNPECTVSNATSAEAFENYEGELNDYVSQFTSACSQYWDDETACQSSTDCFWITDRGHCRWKSAVANSTLTSSGAPPGIIAYDAVVSGGDTMTNAVCTTLIRRSANSLQDVLLFLSLLRA